MWQTMGSSGPVFNDSLNNVISGETVPTVDDSEYPPLLGLLQAQHKQTSQTNYRPVPLLNDPVHLETHYVNTLTIELSSNTCL